MAESRNEVVGLTRAKINGIYDLYVTGSKWDVRRPNPVSTTAGGNVQALGRRQPSGSFDEVVPRDPGFDWASLRNFTVEIFDEVDETTGRVVFAASGCNWGGIGGSSNLAQASVTRSIQWAGTTVITI